MDPRLDQFPFDSDAIEEPPDDVPGTICDGCPGCIELCRLRPLPVESYDVFQLLLDLTEEIVLLEENLVRWRQALTKYLPADVADGLRQDIFDGQSRRFFGDSELYDRFVDEYCAGIDPLESDEHIQRMQRLRDGTDTTSIDYL